MLVIARIAIDPSRRARDSRPVFAPRTATAAFSTVVALAALAVPGALPAAASTAAVPSAASTGATGVIAAMFDWPWPAIGAECTNVLGPDGYGAVQISPPEEAVVLAADGYPWWQAYQPVSYSLNSRFGTEAQLASMISACHAAGVKVYADAVLNHMTGQVNGGVGDDGTTFPDMFDYPPLYSEPDFHSCHTSITDWDDESQVWNCELSGLADSIATPSCGTGTWQCEERWPAIAGMVGWHNAAGAAPVANWWSDGSNAIAFSRGSAAWVAINAESAPVTEDFSTGLPAGIYCDVISGAAAAGGCTGGTVTVTAAGQATVTVPAMSAVGIDVDAVASAAATLRPATAWIGRRAIRLP